MSGTAPRITIVGGGLAGSEAALQLARLGVPCRLIEMRPDTTTPAHRTGALAEIVCSNSLKSTAPATAGRLLKAQLKFHYSGDIPVYSTSSVNSLDGRSNADMNGIMFADTPWVIDPQPWIAHLPAQFAEYWPEERRLARPPGGA